MDADHAEYAEYAEKRGQNLIFLRGHPPIQRSPRPKRSILSLVCVIEKPIALGLEFDLR